MNINIPVPQQFQEDFRQLLTSIAKEVIHDVKQNDLKYPEYMTLKETQAYARCSFVTLAKWQDMGLKRIVLEGKILFSKATVDEFLSSHEQ